MVEMIIVAGLLAGVIVAITGRNEAPANTVVASPVIVPTTEDLPCPWCGAATREDDVRCPSCQQRFG